jgi:hypothetical protein
MAEFKLGRIRFVWKGQWTVGTPYLIDDVVSNGGKSYICVANHTAAALFDTDLDNIPPRWEIVADGTQWLGDWEPVTYYNPGAVVKYGALVYICKTGHTSSTYVSPTYLGLEDDQGNWELFATSFSWEGTWASATRYRLNDFVVYGGTTYVCNTPHISAAISANITATNFTVTAGVATLTYASKVVAPYAVGATITLAGFAPVSTTSPTNTVNTTFTVLTCTTSQLTFALTGTYTNSQLGTVSGASQLGLELDAAKWDTFNQGITYLGDWNSASLPAGANVRYKQNDIVKWGADLWICITPHTSSGTTIDTDKFNVFVNGFQFENSWNSSTVYQIGDTITYGGYSYIAKTNHTNKQPTSNPSDWAVFTTGINFVGEYDAATNYRVGDLIRNGGYTYIAKLDSIAQTPVSATTYWARLNSGLRWTDTPETYLAVNSVTVTGVGSGAKFDVTRTGTVYNVTLTSGQAGLNYEALDRIKILGTNLGGISPANDITITIVTVSTSSVATFTASGRSVTWTVGTDYLLGDTASFGANSYICINQHTASSGDRPDADTQGDYWNLLTAGSEVNILTTTGDLVYYGDNGPERLPSGTNGQVLRSQDGVPVWANYGLINNLVFVGPLGRDVAYPDAGSTIDQPWKSVRYAAKQVEEGYLNPQAKMLLTQNKQFMMKEITNWVNYTYTVNISAAESTQDVFTCTTTENLVLNMPISFTGTLGGIVAGTTYYVKTIVSGTTFTISETSGGSLKQLTTGSGTMTGSLVFNSAAFELDVGLTIEALIHDITHSGTGKITSVAKAYYPAVANTYYPAINGIALNSNSAIQTTQTVAAYNYLSTLVDKVLSNTAWRSYQAMNGITSGVIQIVDTSLTAEAGTITTSAELLSIITDGILGGSVTAIPTPIYANTTISVKTGTFTEILPIVICPYTAITGDELRSTVIQPATANPLLATDKAKTTSALNRIAAVAGSIVQNVIVTPTAGNTETQYFVGGYAGSGTTSTAVGAKTTVISTILSGGLGSVPSTVLTDPTGYDAGYLNARRLIVSNKAFLQAEIAAYMNVNFSTLWNTTLTAPQRAAWSTEVGYLIDSLAYDLTYGGNLETIVTARSYYSFGTFVTYLGSQAAGLAIYTRLLAIIEFIATGDNSPSSWTKSVGNALNQDDSLPHGSAPAGVFANDRIQEVYNTINTEIIPDTIEPPTSWVSNDLVLAKIAITKLKAGVQAGVIEYVNTQYPALSYDDAAWSNDMGYIVDAIAYDIMFGSNFRSIRIGISYYAATTYAQNIIANQLDAILTSVTYIDTAIKQVTTGQSGSVGSTLAVSRVESSADTMYDIVASGLGAVPSLILPTPTGGTGNAYDSNYLNARTQIVNNYAFIKAEIAAYLAFAYNAVWVSLGATGQAGCERDIGLILDGVRYDITYGGNLQSLIVGSAYYSNYVLAIGEGELTATVAAYTRIKTIVGQIAQRQTVTTTAGYSGPSQDLSGTGDLVGAAATFAQARVQDVIDWVSNGYANATITPSITWASSALQTAFAEVQAKKTEIQADTLWWVYKNYQNLNFNADLCSRDAGYIVDALSYDLVFGSNFAAITAGRSYQRATPSAQVVTTLQRQAELGSINFIKYKVKNIAASGAVAQINAIVSDITGFINGGSIPRSQWTNPSTITSAYAAATVLLRDNKAFLQAEIVAWVNINYPSTRYTDAEYSRDVGYIVEALVYDLTYSYGVSGTGNIASLIAGKLYYSALSGILQIDSGDVTATVAAYNRLKAVAQSVVQDTTVTPSAGNTILQVRAASGQTVGSGATATTVGTLVDLITNTITNGLTTGVPRITITAVAGGTTFTSGTHNLAVGDVVIPQSTPLTGNGGFGLVAGTRYYVASTPLGTTFTLAAYQGGAAITTFTNGTGLSLLAEINKLPSTSWVSTPLVTLRNALQSNKATIKNQITQYIATNYTTLVYNSATCERDVGLIVDYIAYDMMFDSNYLTITSARSYFRAQASLVVGPQKAATVASYRYLKTLLLAVVANNATATRRIKVLMDVIINTMLNGIGSTSEVTGTITYKNEIGLYNAAESLRLNKEFLATEATSWINANFGGTVTTTTATTDLFTTSAAHNLIVGDPVNFTGSIITGSGVVQGTTYYVLSTPSATTFTLSMSQTLPTTVDVAANGSGSMTATYAFDATLCKRDMKEYIEGIIYDLSYTGNYRSLRAAELYNNAVNGSTLANMFYVSNGTGLRNCTLSGLNGTLTEENEYGTKRPTAGAYVALNPGFGPNDSNVWVQQRSHYSQNVTMFGTGCSGAKIDGAIHAGGNRSMVKNDFTTILSDGLGVWCTGANSLTELVSVFNYYGYAGYLAELGGRIRATNGNSSYGTYGTIAEGTDTYEQPIFAVVDNRQQDAVISNVVVNGLTGTILRVEYSNAGVNHTNADIGISGDGINVITIADEFRDGGLFDTRIIDLDDGNGYGGTNYVNAINAAQGGSIGEVTIANSDVALATAYPSMRIQLTAGTGVGQFANILAYNNGTKLVKIYKDSFTTLTVTGTAVTNNLLTVASTATLFAGMTIYLGTTVNGLTANTLYYIRTANFSSTQFSVSLTGAAGTAVTITTTTASGLTIPLYAAGWDHAVPGTTISNAIDLTTSYIIEPRISYTAPGYTATTRTVPANTYIGSTFGNNKFVAIGNTGTATAYSLDGKTWASGGVLPASASWRDVVFGGGSGTVASITVGGLGGVGAILTPIMGTTNSIGLPGADQVVGVTIVDGGRNYTTAPTIVFTPTSGGVGAVAVCTVLNGKIDAIYIDNINYPGTSNGSGYNAPPTVTADSSKITKMTTSQWGRNYTTPPTVTVSAPVSATAWSNGGAATSGNYYSYANVVGLVTTTNYYQAGASGTFSSTAPTFQTGTGASGTYGVALTYVGTLAAGTAVLSNTGVSSITITEPGQGYTSTPTISVTDTAAKFVAISGSGSVDSAYLLASAANNAAWTAGSNLPASTMTGIAYGVLNGVSTYVVVGGTGSSSAASSTTGATWTTRSLPTLGSGNYSAVAFGNGQFVAISTGSTLATATSTNGTTWVAGGNLPAGFTTGTSVTYGNGRFVAICSASGTATAYSIDNGTTWRSYGVGLPSTQTWSRIRYGQGLFVVTATGSTVCATSPDGINWTPRTMPGSSSTWSTLAFGNINSRPLWIAMSSTSGQNAASINTGAQALGRIAVASGTITEVRIVEPGSAYPQGTVTATTDTTNLITADTTENLINSQPIIFSNCNGSGLVTEALYYVIGSTITSTQFKVSLVAGSSTPVVLTTATGLTGTYKAGPILTQFDPNKVVTAALNPRTGNGVLANPSFYNRGNTFTTATGTSTGDGNADLYQPSTFIAVRNLYRVPAAGSNVVFSSLPSTWYKLVAVTNTLGNAGEYTATFQISPGISVLQAPTDADLITTTIKYSQVRLTGHDFLYIGTGNQAQTNYPFVDPATASIAAQTNSSGGGRVFFTSTDQDGNFNVGNLFGVQQSTGTATLNADAFNLSGLQSLQLGALNIGVGSAIITQFSTDPYFTANSDNIVPTQRAIKSYITAQIGGGQSSLNVNTLTAGVVYIANDSISTTSGGQLNVKAKMNFTGGIDGAPVALGFFLQR